MRLLLWRRFVYYTAEEAVRICRPRARQRTYSPPVILGLLHECSIWGLGGEEEMPGHPPARCEHFKLDEIAGNLELVSEITW